MSSPQRNVLRFQYDPAESFKGDRYLTPVYFNKQVLVRYLYDSRFYCDFANDTHGTVGGHGKFSMSFGINKNGSVIAWLGDLKKELPKREQFYWLVENKEPENESASEFLDSQMELAFPPPPAPIRCLNALAKFNASFHLRFDIHLYHDRTIEERIEETRRYKRLLLNNIDDFKRFISEFNEIVNENTNNAEVRRFLNTRAISFPKKAKGNKLLQKVYENVLSDTENLIAPFFHLYDLRLWADHSAGDEKRDSVANSLGVNPVDDYQSLMVSLLAAIQSSCEKLEARVGT